MFLQQISYVLVSEDVRLVLLKQQAMAVLSKRFFSTD